MAEVVPLQECNQSELLELVFISRGFRLRRDTSPERLIQLLEDHHRFPEQTEIPGTTKSREMLERWIVRNWEAIQTQLPCKAYNRGHCTVYPCTEARHLACWREAKDKIV